MRKIDYSWPKPPMKYWQEVNKILPDIRKMENMDIVQINRIRLKLRALKLTLSPKKACLLDAVYHQINKITRAPGEVDPRNHYLSDHAFCRCLERVYKMDVNALKDHVMNDLLANKDFEIVGTPEKIMTVWQKHFRKDDHDRPE